MKTAQPVQLFMVCGFLGAGKATPLRQAARMLAARGRRVGHVKLLLSAGVTTGGVAAQIIHLQSLHPGRPRPTHRYRSVVEQ